MRDKLDNGPREILNVPTSPGGHNHQLTGAHQSTFHRLGLQEPQLFDPKNRSQSHLHTRFQFCVRNIAATAFLPHLEFGSLGGSQKWQRHTCFGVGDPRRFSLSGPGSFLPVLYRNDSTEQSGLHWFAVSRLFIGPNGNQLRIGSRCFTYFTLFQEIRRVQKGTGLTIPSHCVRTMDFIVNKYKLKEEA